MKNRLITYSYGVMKVMALGLLLTGCMHAEGKTTVGNTQVSYSGDSGNPEALVRASGNFVQQASAAETEQIMVRRGQMPYYRGGCYGNRCWRHYGRNAAGPLPGGRYDRGDSDEKASEATAGGDSAAEIERLRDEAAQAKKERDEAIDALAETVEEAEANKD